MKLTKRQLSARRAARTRAENRADLKYYYDVTEPANRRRLILSTLLLKLSRPKIIHLRWNPPKNLDRKLKNGAMFGKLVGFTEWGGWIVLADGYKQAQSWNPAFWEILLPW